jgi:hypothetical protein
MVDVFVLQSFRAHPVCLLPSTHAQTLPTSATLKTKSGEILRSGYFIISDGSLWVLATQS